MKLFAAFLLFALSAFGQFGGPKPTQAITVTIANGQSLSPAVALNSCTPLRISTPTGFVATTLTFQVSLNGGSTYGNFRDSYNGEVAVTFTTAGDVSQLDPATFAGIRYLKVRSGTSGTPAAVSADRVITIECKNF